MCDSKAEGGRRCPGCTGSERSSYRKAVGASKVAPEGGIGHGGAENTPHPTQQAWSPKAMTALADDVTAATRDPHLVYRNDQGIPYSDEELDVVRASYDLTDAEVAATHAAYRLHTEHGGTEQAVTVLGGAVAAEAERRAGTGIEDIAALQADLHRQAQEGLAAAQEEARQAKEEYDADPDCAEYERLQALMFSPEGASQRATLFPQWQEAGDRASETAAWNRHDNAEMNLAEAKVRAEDPAKDSQEVTQRLASLSQAYTDTLADIRPIGGVQTTWHETSDQEVAEHIDRACQEVFPSDWLSAHNDGKSVRVVGPTDGERPHYLHNGPPVDQSAFENRVDTLDGPPADSADGDPSIEYRHGLRDGVSQRFYDQRLAAADSEKARAWVQDKYTTWTAHHYEVHDGPDAPQGQDWERHGPVWRRPEKVQVTKTERPAEIVGTTDNPTPVMRGDTRGFRVAVHEMSHRMEMTVPGVQEMERKFLLRRTTGPDGVREAQVPLFDGKSRDSDGEQEMTRPDGFVNAYMGKEYRNTRACEVLSMGVESLFAGTNGGLVGAGKYRSDSDMRAFVLGVMAGVGRKGPDDK